MQYNVQIITPLETFWVTIHADTLEAAQRTANVMAGRNWRKGWSVGVVVPKKEVA